ncbi:MAG: hypothetical protein IKF39_01820 [Oscillospiraceae bacterium]|nr:hypothetical protein [Oscillospiraceae bacterium]
MTEQDKIIQDLQKEIDKLKKESVSFERLQDEIDRLMDKAKVARYEGYTETEAFCRGVAGYLKAIMLGVESER